MMRAALFIVSAICVGLLAGITPRWVGIMAVFGVLAVTLRIAVRARRR